METVRGDEQIVNNLQFGLSVSVVVVVVVIVVVAVIITIRMEITILGEGGRGDLSLICTATTQ